jgi:AraC-like DNA-binding protein
MGTTGTRGILDPAAGLARFQLTREPPPADLAPFVDGYWGVRWDLEGQPPFEQEILPFPNVNLSFQQGRFEVHGPATKRFVTQLSGRGHVLGVRFRPAGFAAFAQVPMRSIADRVLGLEETLGASPDLPDDDQRPAVRAAIERFLRSRSPSFDAGAALANQLVALAQDDRSVLRAEQLAEAGRLSLRSLHRLFERWVGVGPKWVVRRSRVQDAADRVARGEHVDWAALAQEMGYYDQAHFIRDFRAQVGMTPAAYARRCLGACRESEAEVEGRDA